MSKQFYITLYSEKIPVTEEVYRACMQPVWRTAKQEHVRADMEYSYESILESGHEIPSKDMLIEDIVEGKMALENLVDALSQLTEYEKDIIVSLFAKGKTEHEVGCEYNMTRQSLNEKKVRILAKLHKLLEFEK